MDIGVGAAFVIGAGAVMEAGEGAAIEAGVGAAFFMGLGAMETAFVMGLGAMETAFVMGLGAMETAFVMGLGAMETALGARDCMTATSCPGWAPEFVSFTLSLNSASEGKEGVALRLGADTGCEETGAITG